MGQSNKIQEELDELVDAEQQGSTRLILAELVDVYGAVRGYAKRLGLKMEDVHQLCKTKRHNKRKNRARIQH